MTIRHFLRKCFVSFVALGLALVVGKLLVVKVIFLLEEGSMKDRGDSYSLKLTVDLVMEFLPFWRE